MSVIIDEDVTNCRSEKFGTIKEAAERYGLSFKTISNAINGRQRTAGAYEDGTRISWRKI